jgi:hypothetical protein
MSYCRWSSDNWKCDLYCYGELTGGYTTHVAGRRWIGLDPLTPDPLERLSDQNLTGAEMMQRYTEPYYAGGLELEDIDLPHAGRTFHDQTLELFRERVLSLRSLGYRVPDSVLEEIDEEIHEAAVSGESRSKTNGSATLSKD